jgi:hypothetical protein
VAAGLTERDAGEAATLDCVTPSDQTTVQGPAPVSAAWIVVEEPGQMAAVPETAAVGRGSTVTVTVGALFDTQPLASVTVSEYVVVAAGEAVGAQLDAFERPVAGAHTHETPPEPDRGVEEPAQISAEPAATAVGRGLTVTTALPDAEPAQWTSDTEATV